MIRNDDPPCPYCDCPQSEAEFVVAWGQESLRRTCANCSAEWRDANKVRSVTYVSGTACPTCDSLATRVTSSPRAVGTSRVRYHACTNCNARFKSVERLRAV